MIAAFMPMHFGFCLSVGLELSDFEFKSSLNLEQVCKNQKMKKVSLPATHSGPGPLVAQLPRTPLPSSCLARAARQRGLLGSPLPRAFSSSYARARGLAWRPARPSSGLLRANTCAPPFPPLLSLHRRTRLSAAPFSFLLRRSGDGACHPWWLHPPHHEPAMAGVQNPR